jgi:hypothetical protein
MINGTRVSAGVNVPERHEALGVDIDADLFLDLAASRCSEVGVFDIRSAARKNERAWIIAEVVGTTTQIDLDAALGVADERHCGRWYWFALRHWMMRDSRCVTLDS